MTLVGEDPLGFLALLWALVLSSVSAWAMLHGRKKRANPAKLPAVLLIRPCGGDSPWLEETLLSILEARHTFKVAVRFTVSSADDAAMSTCTAVARDLRAKGVDAEVAVHHPMGPNRKASQIASAVAADEGRHRLIISADDDVDLAGTDLDALVLPLMDMQVGAAWAAPVERWPETTGDRAMAGVLSSSLHAFPMLSSLDRGGMVGKLFAWKAVSEAAFDPIVHFLGEDMELARRLRSRGMRVVPTPVIAASRASGRTWEEVAARISRWLLVIRAQRPWLMISYPLLFGATGPIVLLGILSLSPLGMFGAITALAARLGVALAARDIAEIPGGSLLSDALLADVLLWVGFLRAIRSTKFSWRGQPYKIAADGQMVADTAPAAARRAQ